jgi:thioredoxin-related protein
MLFGHKRIRSLGINILNLIYVTWLIIIFALVGGQAVKADTAGSDGAGQLTGAMHYEIPEWFKESFLEIADDAVEADEEGRQLMLFFHLDDCPFCARMLEDNFIEGANADFMREHFDVIDINIRGDREVVMDENTTLPEKELARLLKVRATPAILFVSPENQVVLRTNGYRDPARFRLSLEYVQTRAYESGETLADYEGRTRKAVYRFRDHPAFTTADDLSSLAREPLAIVFEDELCSGCDQVHDVLFGREDVSEALSQLKVVRLDAMSEEPITDPAGRKIAPRDWYRELGLTYKPAVLLYADGEEKHRMDNQASSWYFMGPLKWVAGRHFENETRRDFMRRLREETLAAGKDVNLAD